MTTARAELVLEGNLKECALEALGRTVALRSREEV
jgi:hypothetical protein